jgi:hypothetical protein
MKKLVALLLLLLVKLGLHFIFLVHEVVMARNRGKSKPSLRDLSRIPPTLEERQANLKALRQDESPIATAILGAAMVEHELEIELRACFRRSDDETWNTLTGDTGPLGTFNQKIIAAYGFGIVDEILKDGLNTIRQIRNAFAHAKRLIGFEHELIVRELKSISLPKARRSHRYRRLADVQDMKAGARIAYGTLCLSLCIELLDRRLKRRQAKDSARSRTLRRRKVLSNALLQPPSSRRLGLLGLLAGYQTADPKRLIPGEATPEVPGSEADAPDKKDM